MDLTNKESISTTELPEDTNKTAAFQKIGVRGHLLESIQKKGFSLPTEIQERAIPTILEGKDLIAQAETGSGKTAAFAIPSIQKLSANKKCGVLVLVPTRELAQQVVEEFRYFGKPQKLQASSIVGGEAYRKQIEAISSGHQVLVATPGRLLDLINKNYMKNFKPEIIVLDEADEMLDMGFIDDVRSILSHMPKKRQTLFFSATFPMTIAKLARETQVDPVHIKLVSNKSEPHKSIEQKLYIIKDQERDKALVRLIEAEDPKKAIVFCKTKKDTNELCNRLTAIKISAHALNGDLNQHERNRVIQNFKSGRTKLLVATDIASRGLDIKDLTHVFNYQVPENLDRYTHRIGRTGRAGEKGKAITLATKTEWQTHQVFRQDSKKNFIASEIASKSEIEQILVQRFIEGINTQSIPGSVREKCEKMLKGQDHFEWFCKLYASVVDSQPIIGPDKIGLSKHEIKNIILSPSSSSRNSSRRRPYQSRGGWKTSRTTTGRRFNKKEQWSRK